MDLSYNGTSCRGSVIGVKSTSTAFCSQISTSLWLKYHCTEQYANAEYYSNSACTIKAQFPVLSTPLNACGTDNADDDGYISESGSWDSHMLQCSQGYPSTPSGETATRSLYSQSSCDKSYMYFSQWGYQDECYSNYDGTSHTSLQMLQNYRLDYMGANCVGNNVTRVKYLPPDLCQADTQNSGWVKMTYGSAASTNSNGSSGDDVSAGEIAMGVVLSFFGGVVLTLIAVYLWFRFAAPPPPLSNQEKDANNA